MYSFKKTATVLFNGHQVKLDGFRKSGSTYINVNRQYVGEGWSTYLYAITFTNGKLELLFAERPRTEHGRYVWHVLECQPADEASSRVLRELFEETAYEGEGRFARKVPLVWPW